MVLKSLQDLSCFIMVTVRYSLDKGEWFISRDGYENVPSCYRFDTQGKAIAFCKAQQWRYKVETY